MVVRILVTFVVLFALAAGASSCVSLAFDQGFYLGFGLWGWIFFVSLKASMLTIVIAWRFGWIRIPRWKIQERSGG